MIEHSPTPWRVHQWTYVHCGSDRIVCATISERRDKSRDAANAAFIVRAVNAHEALVEALKAARRFVPDTLPNELLVDQIDAALRLAKGEQ